MNMVLQELYTRFGLIWGSNRVYIGHKCGATVAYLLRSGEGFGLWALETMNELRLPGPSVITVEEFRERRRMTRAGHTTCNILLFKT
jgi:hypothetical protein